MNSFQVKNPPHAVLNAAAFPRRRANDLPFNQRAEFNKKFPNGIPSVYKMMSYNDRGIPMNYLEDNLPIGFYTNPPLNAPAVFSTINGKREFRKMTHILPQRRIHLWDKDEIQRNCNSIRKSFWSHMKGMVQPYCWEDLWRYYDAYDLYNYGAMNLWNLINHLYHENVIIYTDMERECANHIGQWADEWMSDSENQRKLREWTGSSIVFILSKQDRLNMGDIPDDMISLVASALKARRNLLLSGAENFRKCRDGASDVMTACKNRNFHNWLAGERVFENNALASPPAVEKHQCSPASAKRLAPCFELDGRHYYLPEGMGQPNYRSASQFVAVEELKKSVAAAATNAALSNAACIVVRGTSKPQVAEVSKGRMKKVADESQHLKESSAIGPGKQKPVVPLKESSETLNKLNQNQISVSTENNAGPVATARGQTSPSPMPRQGRSVHRDNEAGGKTVATSSLGSRSAVLNHASFVKRASLSGQVSPDITSSSPMVYHRPSTASEQPA
ncbi:hypothetical protein QQS21_006091 [Conoideocrella luteorostrata]|uniref:Uncharacterized protein n=1 Tax=Conoideocrella luteorostrata TaxID=1105319 RepID=A0AAJ0CN91_9HYPO|nr:hypothetical protein QQS21_006091 [Conoideocrella luteorostrata]